MIEKAVILCGGLGTRLLPITKTIPKEMMPLLNKPAIEFCLEDLKQNGITKVLIVLGKHKECLQNYFDSRSDTCFCENKFQGMNIYFLPQQKPLGTGFAVLKAKEFVGNDPFLLIYPDELFLRQSFAKTLLRAFEKHRTNLLPMAKINIKKSGNYGMLKTAKTKLGHQILDILEKPKPKDSPSDVCYCGGGLFLPEIFNFIDTQKTHGKEIFLTDAFLKLIEKNCLFGVFVNGKRLDIGTPLGLLKANVLMGLENQNTKKEFKKFLKNLFKKEKF